MNVLYIISSYNMYGGTTKKVFDLLKYFKNNSSLYVYSNEYNEFKSIFEETGAHVQDASHGKNLYAHVRELLEIIDNKNIEIIQTQFAMGELLGYFIKLFRPHIKLVITFEGPFEPKGIKKRISQYIYRKVDTFIFISEYIKKVKLEQFPMLVKKNTRIIYNGTAIRKATDNKFIKIKHPALLDVAGLVDWKNANILIEAMNIIVNKSIENEVCLYIAGDGPERENLEIKIREYSLENNVYLLGYQKNIGGLLEECDIYVHPAYAEGFGIAVTEAMMAAKPTIVANSGALPELIENDKSGLVVEPLDSNAWAEAILKLIEDKDMAESFGKDAKKRAQTQFSINHYISSFEVLYHELSEGK